MGILSILTRGGNTFCMFAGSLFLMAMVLLTTANILMRLLGYPLSGAYELMGFCGAMAAALALGHTQTRRGHIAVDVLIRHFPKPLQRGLHILNRLICMFFFALCAWQLIRNGYIIQQAGELTETLRIEFHPFIYGVAAGCALLALVLLEELMHLTIKPPREIP